MRKNKKEFKKKKLYTSIGTEGSCELLLVSSLFKEGDWLLSEILFLLSADGSVDAVGLVNSWVELFSLESLLIEANMELIFNTKSAAVVTVLIISIGIPLLIKNNDGTGTNWSLKQHII